MNIQISPRKKSIFSRSLREKKILKREILRRKLHEISRKFAQAFFSPRVFAEKTPRTYAEFRGETLTENFNEFELLKLYLFSNLTDDSK